MKNIENSIQAEQKLLNDIIANPMKYKSSKHRFIAGLKSQLSFAKFEDTEMKIIGCSLNSHKQYVELYYSGLYEDYNLLRKKAYTLLKNLTEDSKNKIPKVVKIEINNLMLDKALKHNILLTSIALNLKNKLEFYAYKSKNEEIINDYEYSIKEIENLMQSINEN